MQKSINTIRGIALDMINEANSGHPGIVMGASPMLYTLFKNHMQIDPSNPNWINRDRFILSAGHGSSMLYALYHLIGYDISLEDLKQFRQINSKTPGHPEYLEVPGVEATTGPLGQGIAMGVGLAYASKKFGSLINTADCSLIDNYTYILCGDGDLMEGISYEACSFAGLNQLDKLIILYDSNDISLDGALANSFNENIKLRFESQGWNYLLVKDGEDINAINNAILEAKKANKSTIIEIKTIIGYGSCIQNTNKVHGAPLTKQDLQAVKAFYQLALEPFKIDPIVYEDFSSIKKQGNKAYNIWLHKVNYLKETNYDKYLLLQRLINEDLLTWDIKAINKEMASRQAGAISLEALSAIEPLLLTGSADLSSSNLTAVSDVNKNIAFGVREFSMGAIANGIFLFAHNTICVSTFLVFSDYLKPAIRLSSLMNLGVIYIFTHDSIYVGEDGPTHQPIEQIATFRAMPNCNVYRPCDCNETICCYKLAYNNRKTPSVLCLSRQALAHITSDDINQVYNDVSKGAYIIYQPQNYQKTIFASGSEVALALEIAKILGNIRVVSVVCFELFLQQDKTYQTMILDNKDNNYVIEFASKYGLDYFVNNTDHIIGLDTFGKSGKNNDVIKALGLDIKDIIKIINK